MSNPKTDVQATDAQAIDTKGTNTQSTGVPNTDKQTQTKKLSQAQDANRLIADAVIQLTLRPVDLCCTHFAQQYIGSHIIENASDTILA